MSDQGTGDFTKGDNLVLGESVPADQRPRGISAWLLGVGAWALLMAIFGLIVWLLG